MLIISKKEGASAQALGAKDFVGTDRLITSNIALPESNMVVWNRCVSPGLEAYVRGLGHDGRFEADFLDYFQRSKTPKLGIHLANAEVTGFDEAEISLKNGQVLRLSFSRALTTNGFSHLLNDIGDVANSIIDVAPSPVTFHLSESGDSTLRFVSENQSRFAKINKFGASGFHIDDLDRETQRHYALDRLPDESVTLFTLVINYMGPNTRYLSAKFYNDAVDILRRSPASKLDKVVHDIRLRHPFHSVVRRTETYAACLLAGTESSGEQKYKNMARVCAIHAAGEYRERCGKRVTLVLRGHMRQSSQFELRP